MTTTGRSPVADRERLAKPLPSPCEFETSPEDTSPLADIRVVPDQQLGLRRAQLGAAWALGAAFMSGRPTIAMAVLPTGAGKSAVLALVPLLVPTDGPILVTAPSRLVRDQLATAFETQATLKRAGVLPLDLAGPVVRIVEHRLGHADEWIEVANGADVVVGTLGVLSPAYPDVSKPPLGLFKMVLVDEAHHTPAKTWAALLEALPFAKRGLVTATPVRADQLEIPGDLVFSYSLAEALRDGVIAPVRFIAVTQERGSTRDRSLAAAAARRLRSSEHQIGRSLILVRAGESTMRVTSSEPMPK